MSDFETVPIIESLASKSQEKITSKYYVFILFYAMYTFYTVFFTRDILTIPDRKNWCIERKH